MKVERTAVVQAPVEQVREWVADVRWWPLLFEGIVHVEVLENSGGGDRLQLWAVDVDAAFEAVMSSAREAGAVPGVVRSWTARRTFRHAAHAGSHTITFRQERPQPPLLSMGGVWEFRAVAGTEACEVVLAHEAECDGGVDRHPWIGRMVEGITESQLAALKIVTQLPRGTAHAMAELSGAAEIPGGADGRAAVLTSLRDRADVRTHPDVTSVDLTGVDLMSLDLMSWDPLPRLPGLAGTLRIPLAPDAFLVAEPGRRGFRLTICLGLPGGRIVAKRLRPPAALLALTDEWTVRPAAGSDAELRVGLHRRALLSGGRHGRRRHDRADERLRSCLAADVRHRLQQLMALTPAVDVSA